MYVDEIHNFLTLSFTDILSEARKYKLYLVMSHQYLDQLDEKMRAAVFGNVGTLISFRVGAIDAKHLAREFYPTFDETDLVNIPNHHIYLKMMIDGHTSKAFSAVTLPPRKSAFSYRKMIIASSREKYGTRRVEVERMMMNDAVNKAVPSAEQSSLF